MTTAEPFYEPIPRVAYVRPRLELALAGRDDASIEWDDVRKTVDDVFEELAEIVASRRPGIKSRAGANQSPAVLLYAYRVFERATDDDVEAVVVGVAFKLSPSGMLVRGDIVGEDSGRVFLDQPECRKEVTESQRAVMEAASDVAARLARRVEALLTIIDEIKPG